MQLQIEMDALDLVFRMLLTCGCPVTPDQELKIFDIIGNNNPGDLIDYDEIIGIFAPNSNTVFHRLMDFCIWQAPVGIQPYVINREHIIRHFSSSYHWNYVVANGLSNTYKKIISVPSWFLGHMMLPVRITQVSDKGISASYKHETGEVRLSSLLAPRDRSPRLDEIWVVHFAGLLDRLTQAEEQVAYLMTESNQLLKQFRGDITAIDYANFERHGDYMTFCRERYRKYYV